MDRNRRRTDLETTREFCIPQWLIDETRSAPNAPADPPTNLHQMAIVAIRDMEDVAAILDDNWDEQTRTDLQAVTS